MNQNFYNYMLRASAAAGNSLSYEECKQLNGFMRKKPTTCRRSTVSCEV